MNKSPVEEEVVRKLCRDSQALEVVNGICAHLKWVSVRSADRRVRNLIESASKASRAKSTSDDHDQPIEQPEREGLDTEDFEMPAEVTSDSDKVEAQEKDVVESTTTVALYDPARARKQLEDGLPKSENSLEEYLQQMAVDGSEQRELKVPPAGAADACRRLIDEFPNMREATTQIAGAVFLAEKMNLPVQLPQLLLDGPPGCGKTELIRQVAAILDLPIITITMSALHGEFELKGCHRSFKGAEPGQLVKSLMSLNVANPIFLFDEAELGHPIYYGPLLSFLEDEWFTDIFFSMPFRTASVNKIFITNNAKRLQSAIQSRMTFVAAKQPSLEAMRILVQRIYVGLIKTKPQFSYFPEELNPMVIEALLKDSLRGVRTRLEAALYRVACRKPDASSLAIELCDVMSMDSGLNYVFPARRV